MLAIKARGLRLLDLITHISTMYRKVYFLYIAFVMGRVEPMQNGLTARIAVV